MTTSTSFDDRGVSTSAVDRRLLPLYIAAFMQSFVLWYAIEKPFLDGIGLDAGDVSTIVVITNIIIVVVNIPLGIVADRWSRKGVLVGAGLALALASTIGGLSDEFDVYVAAAALFALFNAAYSGGYDSVVYDTVVEETGSGDGYNKYYGRVRAIEGVALASSSLFGGLVAWQFETRDAFFVTAPFALASVIALSFFHEPRFHRRDEHADAHRLPSTLRSLLANPATSSIVFTLVVMGAGLGVLLQLDQLWMIELDFPLPLYGPLNAVLLASLAVGGYLAGRKHPDLRLEVSVAAVGVVGACALLIDNVFFVIAGQVVFVGVFTMLSITLGKRLHDATPSRVRSSVSSVVATIGTLVFVPTALAFGVITDTTSVFDAAWISAAIALTTFLGYLLVARNNRG